MARGTGCAGCCGCCLKIAHAFPQTVYQVFLVLLQVGAIGLGAFLIFWAVRFHSQAVAVFVSQEFFYGAIVLGGLFAIISLYGFIAPLCCKGQKDEHLKIFYVLVLLLLLAFIAFTVLAFLNAKDASNQTTMLDYGWQKAFSNPAKSSAIASAELAYTCCGFFKPADRAIQPCPAAGKAGCQAPMQKAVAQQLGFLGILFAAGAGGCLLMMMVAHGWIEKVAYERQTIATGTGNPTASFTQLDKHRMATGRPAQAAFARQAGNALPSAQPRGGYAADAYNPGMRLRS